MGKIETTAKEYFSDNRRFADFCNGFFFEGKQYFSAEDFAECDTDEAIKALGLNEQNGIYELKRWDLLKEAVLKKTSSAYVLLIFEGEQTKVRYAMPIKNMMYGAAFLSGINQNDTVVPVITVTVYLGPGAWDGPRSLHDMFGGNVNDVTRLFCPDYKINLFVPGERNDFNCFGKELRAVFKSIKAASDKELLQRLLEEDSDFKEADNETANAINVFTGFKILTTA